MNTNSKDAIIVPFEEYTVHYYSQSSAQWEAAYINCFEKTNPNTGVSGRQAGVLVFTYPQQTNLPGQEPTKGKPTDMPTTQMNRLEIRDNKDFFVLYYDLKRFNDVINVLRYCKNQPGSMAVSANPYDHIWALCNILRVENGTQYIT